MKKVLQFWILVFFAGLIASQAWAQSSGQQVGQRDDRLAKMSCLIATDFYIVHFTAFQPKEGETDPKELFRPYCQDLPEASKAYLTVDLVDRDVRSMPVGLRLIEEAAAEDEASFQELRTLETVPAKAYKTGVVETEANFDKPGHYALLVDIGDTAAEEDTIRIPLRVGLGTVEEQGQGGSSNIVLIVILVTAILMIYQTWRSIKRRKQST